MVELGETISEIDILAYERQQREFLHELHRKRILLDECREELNESILKHQDLERQLINEKRKNENDYLQNQLLMNGAKLLEDERHDIKHEHNKLKVQLEILTSERDALREQSRTLQLENIKSSRQIDELESKHRCHSAFQNDIIEQQNRIKSAMNQCDQSMQNVKKKQETVLKVHETLAECRNLQLITEQCRERMDLAVKQRNGLEEQLIIKTAELEQMKYLLTNSPLIPEEASIVDYWKTRTEELQIKLDHESELVIKLTNSLKLSNDINCNSLTNPGHFKFRNVDTQTDKTVLDEIDLTVKGESPDMI